MYQTLLYRTLDQYFDRSNIVPAIVICPEIANSSLGPNLLNGASLSVVNIKFYNLLLSTASNDNYKNTTLQFTPSFSIVSLPNLNTAELKTTYEKVVEFLRILIATPYFCRSLQTLHFCGVPEHVCRMFDGNFTSLRSFSWRTYPGTYNNSSLGLSTIASFPNLSEVVLKYGGYFDSTFFGYLGGLENCQRLTSFTLEIEFANEFDSKAFQREFCGRFLKWNEKLRKLELLNWTSMTNADWKVFGKSRMPNIQELGVVPASCFDENVRGDDQEQEEGSFPNLLQLVCTGSSESLANVGNHCLQLQRLTINLGGVDSCDGSFLSLSSPVAFNNIRKLQLVNLINLHEDKIGTGFSRLHSLEELDIIRVSSNFEGGCLCHIPNPHLLKKLNLVYTSVPQEVLATAVSKFTELRSLKIVNNQDVRSIFGNVNDDDDEEGNEETGGGFASLKALRKLETLVVVDCRGLASSSDAMTDVFSSLPNLTSIDCSLTAELRFDAVLSLLEKCSQIETFKFFRRTMRYVKDPLMRWLQERFPKKELNGGFDILNTDKEAFEKYCKKEEETKS